VGAITQFDKVVTQYPAAKDDCAKALFQKGLSQKALGQTEAAVQTFQQLKQDYPDNALAAQAQQQLDALGQ
jgi:TolA-binding protein